MIEDETSLLREVLVGPPENFEWLPTSAISKAALASGITLTRRDVLDAHAEMVSAYVDAGVTVHTLPADPVLPYQVFSRDSSVWGFATGPIVTQLHQSWRRGEYAPVLDFYEEAGHHGRHRITAGALEGGDLVLPAARTALIGFCGERTEEPAAHQLAGWLDAQGWQVRVQPFDPHFVHIDVIVNVVAPGLAVICAEAAPPRLQDWLLGLGLELIEVSYRDCMALGANAMCLGRDRVVSTRHASALNERLRAMGLTVSTPTCGRSPWAAAARTAWPSRSSGTSRGARARDRRPARAAPPDRWARGRPAGGLDDEWDGHVRSCTSASTSCRSPSSQTRPGTCGPPWRGIPRTSSPSARTSTPCPPADGWTARSVCSARSRRSGRSPPAGGPRVPWRWWTGPTRRARGSGAACWAAPPSRARWTSRPPPG